MRWFRFASGVPGCLLAASLLASSLPVHAATISIVNNDGAGEGFNDPNSATPVGGNNGTTIGQQRLNVFQEAADIWGALLVSDVTIQVRAQFNAQQCDANGAILGSAGTITLHANFTNAPVANTWYPQALANKLANADLDPNNPDISATFNSAIDTSCLPGTLGWYYGLDGVSPTGDQIALLPVVLHEIAHGLGFASYVDESTGKYVGNGPNNLPDIFTTFIFDNTASLLWTQMTTNQRKASAINAGNVVWVGASVTAAAPGTLETSPRLTVDSPQAIAGEKVMAAAGFGGPVPNSPGITDTLVLGNDGTGTTSDACEPLVNGSAISGNIALVDRGTCNFVVKVKNAQNAGAIAVIVANNDATPPFSMSGSDPTITIPAVMISQADGTAIKNNSPATATLDRDPTLLSGADANGRVLLYAPNPVEPGSSISHWDDSALPNLLMEPAINDNLSRQVDLTINQLQDIGWIAVPPVSPTPTITPGGLTSTPTATGSASSTATATATRTETRRATPTPPVPGAPVSAPPALWLALVLLGLMAMSGLPRPRWASNRR